MQDITIYDSNNNVLTYATQWDTNVAVKILEDDLQGNDITHVNFFNARSTRALVMDVEHDSENGYYITAIPNILLEDSSPIFGYTTLRVNVGGEIKERALYRFYITVRKQPQPSDRIYAYTNEQDYIDAVEIIEEVRQYAEDCEIYADRAEQAAGQSGYMCFYINSDGDLIYERTSNVNVDFSIVDGDLIIST